MTQTTARPKTVWMLGHRVTLIPCGGSHFLLDITTPPGVPGRSVDALQMRVEFRHMPARIIAVLPRPQHIAAAP